MQHQTGEQNAAFEAAERGGKIEGLRSDAAGGGLGECELVLVDIADGDDAREQGGVGGDDVEKDLARKPAGAPRRQKERRRRERERIACRRQAQPAVDQSAYHGRQKRHRCRNRIEVRFGHA